MNFKNKQSKTLYISFLFISTMIIISNICAQEVNTSTTNPDTLLSIARTYISAVRYCAIITVDSTGRPHAREMDPFLPDENMVVFLGTNRNSRKVQELQSNSKVTLYYSDDRGEGYVAIIGTAMLVDTPKEKSVYWKKEWDKFYKDQKENYLLIKVIPDKLEILNYKQGIFGDKETWEAPSVEFKINE